MIFSLLVPFTLYSAEYYVSTTGDDNDPGTFASPWETFQKAASTALAGDIVYFRGGVYYEGGLAPANSGNAGSPIVFMAYQDETPVIDGSYYGGSNGFAVYGKSYFKLEGFEIRNYMGGHCIWLWDCRHFELKDLTVHHSYFGIGCSYGSHDFVLNNVEIHHFTLYGFDATGNGSDCYNGEFVDCSAHSCNDDSQNVDGFALGHGSQSNFSFTNCTVYDVYDGFDMSANDVTIDRCMGYDCVNGALKLWGDNISVKNSLFWDNYISNVQVCWRGSPKSVTLQNCFLGQSSTYNIWISDSRDELNMYACILAGGDNNGLCFEDNAELNYSGDYNIFHNDNDYRVINYGFSNEFSMDEMNNGDWASFSGEDDHSIVSYNPADLFTDYAGGDFHLSGTSAAIDVCPSAGFPETDYEGNPRPYGAGCDAGPYEKQDVCYEELILRNLAYTNSNSPVLFKATDFISIAGNSTTLEISSGGKMTAAAVNYVKLLPGFHAQSSSSFHAYTSPSPCSITFPRKCSEEIISEETCSRRREQEISVYPNPNDGSFEINFSNSSEPVYEISVMNILGQKSLFRKEEYGSSFKIKLKKSTPGVYYITLKQKNRTISRKVIVK